jgi:hypothetical protein
VGGGCVLVGVGLVWVRAPKGCGRNLDGVGGHSWIWGGLQQRVECPLCYKSPRFCPAPNLAATGNSTLTQSTSPTGRTHAFFSLAIGIQPVTK